jgi:hypothetical protein
MMFQAHRLPDPLAGEELARLVAALLSPPHRELFKELLLSLLGEDIVAIAVAAAKEANCGQ